MSPGIEKDDEPQDMTKTNISPTGSLNLVPRSSHGNFRPYQSMGQYSLAKIARQSNSPKSRHISPGSSSPDRLPEYVARRNQLTLITNPIIQNADKLETVSEDKAVPINKNKLFNKVHVKSATKPKIRVESAEKHRISQIEENQGLLITES